MIETEEKKSHGVEYSLRPQSTKWSQYTAIYSRGFLSLNAILSLLHERNLVLYNRNKDRPGHGTAPTIEAHLCTFMSINSLIAIPLPQ